MKYKTYRLSDYRKKILSLGKIHTYVSKGDSRATENHYCAVCGRDLCKFSYEEGRFYPKTSYTIISSSKKYGDEKYVCTYIDSCRRYLIKTKGSEDVKVLGL